MATFEGIKLSRAGKMPCRSWSLEALLTCPGSKDKTGQLVPACQGCYATTGNYRFPNVKAPRAHNRQDWKRDAWVSDMAQALDNDRYFRWFDSGDCYALELAQKILQVMRATPHCNHWLPTRMHKFVKFRRVFAQMESLPNVVVRYSSDGIQGEIIEGAANSSTIIATAERADERMTLCTAYQRDGKCGTCRACWDKSARVIAYPAHGKQMLKLVEVAA